MKKILVAIAAFLFPFTAFAVQISVPSAPGAGYGLTSLSTGNYQASTTNKLIAGTNITFTGGTPYVFGPAVTISATGGAFPFTPTTNFGLNVNSTSTPIWFQTGLQASSTSQFEALNVGTTTGTSTFANAVQIGSTARDNALAITASRNYSSSASLGGMVNLTNTNNLAAALTISSNAGVGRLADLVTINNINAANDQRSLSVTQGGTRNGLLVNCTNSTKVLGQECVAISDAAGANTSPLGLSGSPVGLGLAKFTFNGVGDANSSMLSMNASAAGYLGQGIFIDSTGGTWSGKILNLRANGSEFLTLLTTGNLGLSTTSPYARLSVVGQTVSEYFTATSTSLASTFPYASTTVLTASTASTTNLILSSAGGVGTRCLQVGSDGTVSANASACGSGSGGIGNPFTNPAAGQSATTSLMLLNGGASTTMFSAYGPAYFGATATSSFSTAGALTLVTPLLVGSGGTGRNTFTSSELLYGNGTTALSSVATTSVGCSGNIACTGFTALGSASTISFTGTLAIASGGTGSTTAPVGQLLYGGSTAYQSVATSSFAPSVEFTTTGTLGSLVGGAASTLSLATNGVALTKIAQIAANTILGNKTGATANVTAFGTSTLGIAISDTTGTLAVSRGGTNATTFAPNSIITSSADGLSLVATTSSLTVSSLVATSSVSTSTFAGGLSATNCFEYSGKCNSPYWLAPYFAGFSIAQTSQTFTANVFVHSEFEVPDPLSIDQVCFTVGGTQNGNVQAAIYGPVTSRDSIVNAPFVASTTSIAETTLNTAQCLTIATGVLQPGQYYVGLQSDSSTGTFMRQGATAQTTSSWNGTFQVAYGNLPTVTATTSTATNTAIPGIKLRVVKPN